MVGSRFLAADQFFRGQNFRDKMRSVCKQSMLVYGKLLTTNLLLPQSDKTLAGLFLKYR